jgi:ferric-dicitrate binding protein FerR (iron transport regulator)
MTAIIREDAEPLPATVPAPLRWIIERLLAKDPSERYESTRDLYRELRQLRDRLSEASTAASATRAPTASKPRIWTPILAVAAVILAAAFALDIWVRWNGAKPNGDRPPAPKLISALWRGRS